LTNGGRRCYFVERQRGFGDSGHGAAVGQL
jgi:hypothetical protein